MSIEGQRSACQCQCAVQSQVCTQSYTCARSCIHCQVVQQVATACKTQCTGKAACCVSYDTRCSTACNSTSTRCRNIRSWVQCQRMTVEGQCATCQCQHPAQ